MACLDIATDSGRVENGHNLEQVVQENLVEEVGLAVLEAIEVDVLFKPRLLAAQLGEDTLTVVGGEEVGRETGGVVEGSKGHDGDWGWGMRSGESGTRGRVIYDGRDYLLGK